MGQGLATNRTSGTNFYVLDVLSITQSCLLRYQKKLHILILITNYKSMASLLGMPLPRQAQMVAQTHARSDVQVDVKVENNASSPIYCTV